MLDLLLQEYMPFAKIDFSGIFSAAFWDIQLKFGTCISVYFDFMQINFQFFKASTLTGEITLS